MAEQTLRYLVMAAEHASRTWAKAILSLSTPLLSSSSPEQEGAQRKSLLLRRGITLLESGRLHHGGVGSSTPYSPTSRVMSRWRRFSAGAAGLLALGPRGGPYRPAEPQNWLIRWRGPPPEPGPSGDVCLAVSFDGHLDKGISLGEQAVNSWQAGDAPGRGFAILLGVGTFRFHVGRIQSPAVEASPSAATTSGVEI